MKTHGNLFRRATTRLGFALAGVTLCVSFAATAAASPKKFRSLNKISSQRLAVGGEFSWQGWDNFILLTDSGRALDVATPVKTDGPVEGIVEVGSKLYIWGDFQHVNGQARNHIAQIDENTGALGSWTVGFDDDFNPTMVKQKGAHLYVSGYFSHGVAPKKTSKARTYRFALSTGTKDPNWSTNRAASVIRFNGGEMFYAQDREVYGSVWKVSTGTSGAETKMFTANHEIADFIVRNDGFYVVASRRGSYGSTLSNGTWVQRRSRTDGSMLWEWDDPRTGLQLRSFDEHKRVGAIGSHVVVMFEDEAMRFRVADGIQEPFTAVPSGQERCWGDDRTFDDFYYTSGNFLVVGDSLYRCSRHGFVRTPRFFEGTF